MDLPGSPHNQFESWLGLPLDKLDSLPLREQRRLVKKRARDLLTRARRTIVVTKPIDPQQNAILIA
jgi:hypothetical protein